MKIGISKRSASANTGSYPQRRSFSTTKSARCAKKTSAACMEKHGPVPRLSERFLNAESGAYNIKTPLCLTAYTRWKIPLIMMACVEGTRSSKSCVTVCTRSSGCAALPFFSCPTKDAAAAKSAHIQPPPQDARQALSVVGRLWDSGRQTCSERRHTLYQRDKYGDLFWYAVVLNYLFTQKACMEIPYRPFCLLFDFVQIIFLPFLLHPVFPVQPHGSPANDSFPPW